jgi:hypothetical protein
LLDQKAEKRFWSEVDKAPGHGPKGECWQWTAGRQSSWGYGAFRLAGRTWAAHRISFWLVTGQPPTRSVLHHCDNVFCVNPAHLYEGDDKDNARDRWSRGRGNPSLWKHSARLSLPQVRNIKAALAMGVPALRLARIYRISGFAISCIYKGVTWRHI